MHLLQWGLGLVIVGLIGACMPSTTETADDLIVPLGKWTLIYEGQCQIYEAETIHLSHHDDEQLIFDDIVLVKNEAGQYIGGIESVAAMPEDGRDIPFTIDYRLSQQSATKFVGDEITVEGGGREDACPIEVVYVAEN